MRKPDRITPKTTLQAYVSTEVYDRVRAAARSPAGQFQSFSEFTETVLFLSQYAYHERPQDGFAWCLLHIKAQELIELRDLTVPRTVRKVNMTIDSQACAFLDELTAHYPALFGSRNEALELIFAYAARLHEQHAAYFARRLNDVQQLHPKRKRKGE